MSADNNEEACRINTADFEGPLDLLLYLIRRDELDVTTVHVAEVAQQYLEYIKAAEKLNLDTAGEYLVMAATLTRMKSRLLLPVEKALMEETEDPMETLMRHLLLYKAFREIAGELRDSESVWRERFFPPGERELHQNETTETPSERHSLLDLLNAVEGMREKNTPPPEHRVTKTILSLRECVVLLDKRLPPAGNTKFTDTVGKNADTATIVSFFVAILELTRRGWLITEQPYPLAEITIRRLKERWKADAG